ncbi:MAG: plasmid segregation actin-type ATPase ParM, partial [Lachnospiraceae bacterium]
MYLKDKNVLVAAIDHGFCTCKTPHVVFENGIQAFGVAPAFTEKTMRYKGKYYKVGEGRLPMKNVKTEDEDYFLLTLAGIAYEMDYYGLRYADVVMAAGLPFAR